MDSFRPFALIIFFFVSLTVAIHSSTQGKCRAVTFKVYATGNNVVFAYPPNPTNETQVLEFFAASLSNATGPLLTEEVNRVSDVWTIKGTFCHPSPSDALDTPTLQLLVHGLSYNKTMWNGYGLSDGMYDWQAFATKQGYHTLAFDRLGHGENPQRPDPLNVVQGSLSTEIVHRLIESIKCRRDNPLGRKFDTLVYVGHSYGSLMGAALTAHYPHDVDALVLTGYSFPNFDASSFANAEILPAARKTSKSSIFDRSLPLGYITFGRESERESGFYAGRYDKDVALVDYEYGDQWTTGETGNFGFLSIPPVNYTGPLFIATGVQDVLFCAPPQSKCESILQSTHAVWFQGVVDEKFGFYAPDNTGHCLTLHYSAPETFRRVHAFLKGVLS
jgi:pimeloyl-ACP methyl ester carboxylesterase